MREEPTTVVPRSEATARASYACKQAGNLMNLEIPGCLLGSLAYWNHFKNVFRDLENQDHPFKFPKSNIHNRFVI